MYYLIPCIILLNHGPKINKSAAATPVITATNQNTFTGCPMVASIDLDKVSICEAPKLPAANENIHTPISVDTNFGGANLVTIDKPMGEIHNSPMVNIR